MKVAFLSWLFFLLFANTAKADHITGGEMFYTFSDLGNSNYRYSFTLKLFMRCNSGRQFSNPTTVSIFDRSTNSRIKDINVGLASQETLQLSSFSPCITNPPNVCYVVGYYYFSIDLPASENGYLVASQVNYRIAGIDNFNSGYSLVGATYTSEIPGTKNGSTSPANNSAQFTANDLVVVCAHNSFTYSFAAQDLDGDKLRYSFCDAYASGTQGNPSTPPQPPYEVVPYGSGFSGSDPLGNLVHIDPTTGVLTGIAPSTGIYVVTVCVEEIRNGIVIATQRKDIQVNVSDCSIASASLLPLYMLCKDSKTINLSNLSNSNLIHTYNWTVLDRNNSVLYTSTTNTLNYTFQDTGIYTISLIINKGEACSDSSGTIIKVYPGLKPSFSYSGVCATKPTLFTNNSTTAYGSINSWQWDFGEPGAQGNTSFIKDPQYTYISNGTRNVMLIVSNTNGCMDTATNLVSIIDKPPLNFAFRDTLICSGDSLKLESNASGNFTWQPSYNIINSSAAQTVVYPAKTTTYIASINDNGCKNTDSIKVRVVDFVTVKAAGDSTICAGDTVALRATTNGLHYLWQPSGSVFFSTQLNTSSNPSKSTNYIIISSIGHCQAMDSVSVKVVPYPLVNAGNDTTICFNTGAKLNGSTTGTKFNWTPSFSLSNSTSLSSQAFPKTTTEYILSATDTLGCPKPVTSKVVVTVLPKIIAFAGNDTTIVLDEPLQLNATGGTTYQWSPSNYLSATTISNPVAQINSAPEDVLFKVLVYNQAGCVDSDFILVKVFKTVPSVFVPTAFTPNGDGLNETLKAMAVGMQKIEYFRIFNRWGQLIFNTSENGRGWDGKIGGQPQGTGTYVWEVKAVDFNGKPYFNKGLSTLIR
jgi:gliding motility-associated-like protein